MSNIVFTPASLIDLLSVFLTFLLGYITLASKKVNLIGGDRMKESDQILELVRQNNGVITTAMVVNEGFSRGSLKYLADIGRLEHAARGVYTLPEAWEDEFINIQSRYKRGIYSLDTALFLCDLTDRTPVRTVLQSWCN